MQFQIDAITGAYQMGDLSNANNGARILLNDTNRSFTLDYFATGTAWIFVDDINGFADFGNSSGMGNTTKLRVNDTANEFQFSNGGNTSAIRINNQLGFTGTVTPVTSITVVGGIVTNVT